MKRVIISLVLFIILSVLLINTDKNQFFHHNSTVYADTNQTVTLKVRIVYNADIDRSGRVDGKDLALMMYYYGKDMSNESYKDINGDKIFDVKDAEIMENHFGVTR